MIDLLACAHSLVSPGRGILAADESITTADKRLKQFGISGGPDMRRKERDLFLAAPGIEKYLSGVILYEETLDQISNDGVPFPKLLRDRGIVPGIKVDGGTEPFQECPNELVTSGLLGLPERLLLYRSKYQTGFTKWRAVFRIDGDRLPSSYAIAENVKRLGSYARAAQEAGMVPIIEPEVLLEGAHSRKRAHEVIEHVMDAVVTALCGNAIDLSGIVIKTSMALSGDKGKKKDTPEEVAADTVSALMESIPRGIAGIVFLSGGQTPEEATDRLRAIAREAKKRSAPWPVTFSFARALQEEALAVWQGKDENVPEARRTFLARLEKVFNAAQGS